MAPPSPRYRARCRVVLLLALAALLGHVCALEGTHAHPPFESSSAGSADTHAAGSVAIHEASCDGLKPTSTSPVLPPIGSRPLAVPHAAAAAPASAAGIVSAPARRSVLFVLHGALLI
jgi:hypothetical protein